MHYLGKTRSNLGKNDLHPQKYALLYTYGYYHNSIRSLVIMSRFELRLKAAESFLETIALHFYEHNSVDVQKNPDCKM